MADALKGELVSFETKDKLMLHGFLVRPKRRSSRALIHVHGLRGKFYGSSFADTLAKEAVNNGINFLSIELRGSYTSLGFRKRKKGKPVWISAGGGFEKFEDCIYDIDAAIRFLKRQGIKEIYLEGHSTGCQKISYYQYKKKDRNVKALVLAAPADDYNIEKKAFGKDFGNIVEKAKIIAKRDRDGPMPKNNIIKSGFSVSRFLSISNLKFVEARLFNYDSIELKEFGNIKQPILAVFGSKEEHRLKPVKEYMKILENNTSSIKFNYLIIKGADHGFSKHGTETAKAIIKWLKSLKVK